MIPLKCPNCGSNVMIRSALQPGYCKFCGSALSLTEEAKESLELMRQREAEAIKHDRELEVQQHEHDLKIQEIQEKRRSFIKGLILVILVILIPIIVVVFFKLLFDNVWDLLFGWIRRR